MRKLLFVLAPVAVAVALGPTAGGRGTRPRPAAAVARVAASAGPAVAATNRLALALLPRLGGSGNVVFSPFSIAAALSMADQGAAGGTAAQLGHVLGSANATALAADEAALATRLKAAITPPPRIPHPQDAPKLSIANGLWLDSGLMLESPFQTTLAQDFGAAPQPAAFSTAPEAARRAINAWVAEHTEQLIRNLLPPGSINVMTRLVLANAIYLKAHWQSPFAPGSTRQGSFRTLAGRVVHARFMTQPPAEFSYGRGRGYQAIDLPYLDSSLSMLVVMPAAGTVATFQRRLTPGSLARIASSAVSRLVDLRMPRFRLRLHASLKPVLAGLGMPVAFSDFADFSGITHQVALKIHDVVHGATLRVDEQGTVAAAATGITFVGTSAPGGAAVHLTLDHPFLVFLRDRATGAILFAARVADPTGS